MNAWIRNEDETGVTIALQVIPRARRSEVAGPQGEVLKVRVAAPPIEGAANEALISFLAAALGVRKRDIALLSGERGRRKLLRIHGLTAGTIADRLLPNTPGSCLPPN